MTIIETQYEQLSNDVRHYNTQLYVIPTTLLVILGAALKFAVERNDDFIKLGIIGFTVIICHTFTTLFAKLSIYQRLTRAALTEIENSDPASIKVARATGDPDDVKRISRAMYKKNSPLWLYFYGSADRSIVRMMTLATFSMLLYFIKNALDMTKSFNLELTVLISAASTFIIFIIYRQVISRKPA